ncbi:winged helix-turn-helix transcriptional regulator [Streptomyces sp. So13.3]|uniref:ArsR family transcriptional regulator n=1 Tax=Streptomyces TaxID=1883 RepID=UPI001106A4CF|nr:MULTISPECIES: ArsR family transcriptional regulator [Streptomyces]MCZ4099399.1 ArsR family transcriptional regulator [Streptomyces sp. H39-C1]QNA77669.1 winged helix-turn-helix transcriptional regulator [Streptomyces sp. So13.3]
MLQIEFTAEDVARTRFAVSPLWEVVASVRVLKGADEQGLHRRWTDQVRPRLAAAKLDLAPLSALVQVPTYGIPGFLVPPPTTPQPSLDVELATLRATPFDLLRTSSDAAQPGVEALRADPERGLGRLADTIAAYWDVAIAPHWPRIRTLLEGDILHRAQLLAEGGARRLFDDLDPQLGWDSGTLNLAHRFVSGERTLDGRGLLLCPSAFIWPRIFSTIGYDPWQPTLRYPPRGVGTLWNPRTVPTPTALSAVLGRSRTLLLAHLTTPATTTDLAARTGLTAGGASQHLTAMRAAGLVTAHRTGRLVLYARTSVAEALLTAGD